MGIYVYNQYKELNNTESFFEEVSLDTSDLSSILAHVEK